MKERHNFRNSKFKENVRLARCAKMNLENN